MPTTTPAQGFRVPVGGDDPDVVDDMTQLAKGIEKRVMGVYATTADRNTKTTAAGPVEGMFAYCMDTNTVTYYDGAAWQPFPPPGPQITSGTGAPNNASGNDNDIYYQYT